MSVDGKYEVELQTTLGPQPISLILKTNGASLSGTMDGHFGNQSFSGGTVNGNELAWSVNLQSPMGVMQLDVKGTVNGDSIEGQVQLGSFRPTPFKGKRA
ncbi:MAG: hypothetical protein A2Z28_03310 [Chloroflexi bacterium RBG_16_51_9]|nr:MAG: hypothetical protein A2Z28_03310 [Chloroflexi bacterium RBG_16_51_9]